MSGHGQGAVMEGRCQAISNRPWTGGGDGGKVPGRIEQRCQWTGGGDGGKVPGHGQGAVMEGRCQPMDRRR